MGELILFRPRAGRSSRPRSAAPLGAQIMFFTGVRYERMEEPDAVVLGAIPEPTPAEGLGRPGRGRKRGPG